MKRDVQEFKRIKILFLWLVFIQAGLPAEVNAQGEANHNGTFMIRIDPQQEQVSSARAMDVMREKLGLSESYSFSDVRSTTDKAGNQHIRKQMHFRGVPVKYGVITYHINRNGLVYSLTGESYKPENENTQPSITAEDALSSAKADINATRYGNSPTPELVFYKGKLAFDTEVNPQDPFGKYEVFVDATDGKILDKFSKIIHTDAIGTAETRYSGTHQINTDYTGTTHILKDNIRGNGIHTYDMNGTTDDNPMPTELVDADNVWSAFEHNASKKDALLDVHWGLGVTYDYFLDSLARSSYDGAGAVINAYANYGNPYFNAFWDGSRLVFGSGLDPNNGPMTSLDVVAHEFGHAVCENTANLIYSYESGALNESLSDVWGAVVEDYANHRFGLSKDLWTNGSELFSDGDIIRNYANPNAKNQPDTYQGLHWYTGAGDNGGVHYNSGVMNYWFYLLASPGAKQVTNDFQNSYTITSIGINDLASIVYHAETSYLTSNSQYIDARNFTLQATEDIFGVGSVQANAVNDAWKAVGVPKIYCNVNVNDPSIGWINSVEIADEIFQNENTTSPYGYTDYTTTNNYNFNAVKGQTYTFTFTPSVSIEANVVWRAWLDFNIDGVIDQDYERFNIYGQPQDDDTVTFQYTIPDQSSGVKVGATKLRVKMTVLLPPHLNYNSPCGEQSYGEVEDYLVTISPLSCDPPTNIEATITDLGMPYANVTFSWTDPNFVDQYEIRYKKSYEDESAWIVEEVEGLEFVKFFVAPGALYEYQLRTICPTSNSDWSSIQMFTLPGCEITGSLTASNVTDNSALLSWDDPAGGNYIVQYRPYSPSPDWTGAVTMNVLGQSQLSVSGLFTGANYEARLYKACESENSIYFRSTNFVTLCGTPQNLFADNIQLNSVDLYWLDPNGIGNYEIYHTPLAGGITSILYANGANQITLGGLNFGTSYKTQIRRMCGGSRSQWIELIVSTLCPAPTSLTLTNINYYTAGFSWPPVAGVSNYIFEYRKTGENWIPILVNGTNKTIAVTGGTDYQARVKAVCQDNTSSYTPTINVVPPLYCSSNGQNTAFEWIDLVKLGALSKVSGASAGGYVDNTAISAPGLVRGSSQQIQLSLGNGAFVVRTRYFRVWIDFNRDGDFFDPNELVVFTSTTSSGPINSSFLVPLSAHVGVTRMRVSMKYNSLPSSCEVFSAGEVEDYSVNIQSNIGLLTESESLTGLPKSLGEDLFIQEEEETLYPNPTNDLLFIHAGFDLDNTMVRILDNSGRTIMTVDYSQEGINVKALPAGLYYLIVQQDSLIKMKKRFIRK